MAHPSSGGCHGWHRFLALRVSVEITAGPGEERGDGFQSRDTLSATGTLSPTTNYTLVAATGDHSLADGRDGQTKEIIMTTTGNAVIHLTGTSTGALVFSAEDDAVCLLFRNDKWRLLSNSGATVATAT